MEIKIKIRPTKYVSSDRSLLLNKVLSGFTMRVGTSGVYYGDYSTVKGLIRCYSIEKINAKWRQEKYKTGTKKGQTKRSVKVRGKEWVAYVYTFDAIFLHSIGKTIIQSKNTFKII